MEFVFHESPISSDSQGWKEEEERLKLNEVLPSLLIIMVDKLLLYTQKLK